MTTLKGAIVPTTWRAAIAALALFLVPSFANAQQKTARPTTMAQKLVNETHAKHPEANEIGIAVTGAKGCSNIASTDKGDIGEKCEKDDSEPIRTGKPYIEKEKNSFDVSLPLHDLSGKLVGSVGIEIAPKAGQTEHDVVQQAQKIAAEMESGIPSKASLLRPF